MSYKYIGENMPELSLIPAKERRRVFLKAVGKSYLYARTWLGLLLFCGISYVGANYSEPIADKLIQLLATPTRGRIMVSIGLSLIALFMLYRFQIAVIKDQILKTAKSQQLGAEYAAQGAASSDP